MNYKGFQAKIMKAQRLTGLGAHLLPPGIPIEVESVDVFEQPLPNWIKGEGNYVVPVDSDEGLWFDWTMNDQMNTAVLLSIKGMNPVTGRRTNGFALERYEEKCPVHDIKFQHGHFCEKCNYKWPVQNYIASPNILWWDGFRSEDGKVRQFFFTEDLAKSIPELVIGKEDTIPAFGFAFYRPKIQRQTMIRPYQQSGISGQSVNYSNFEIKTSSCFGFGETSGTTQTCFLSSTCDSSVNMKFSNSSELLGASVNLSSIPKHFSTKHRESIRGMSQVSKTAEVGVGAGAEINQNLEVDTLKVSDWENEPSSVMRLYFIFKEQFEELKLKGMRNLVGEKEGYLAGLPVG